MKEPVWIEEGDALVLHDRVLAEHCGGSGVRDDGLLKSALARPPHHFVYAEEADIVEMAMLLSRWQPVRRVQFGRPNAESLMFRPPVYAIPLVTPHWEQTWRSFTAVSVL